MSVYLTGFADEAGFSIDDQIKATLELGWRNIESRTINDINIHDLDEKTFNEVEAKLKDSGVRINCFGSAIANWRKEIDQPMVSSMEEIKRAIPRMQRLGTEMVRIMSFAVLKDREAENQMKEERFERVRKIVDIFNAEGLLPVHENCMNFGGMSYKHTLELVENVPGLKLVFDTGNPVFTDDRSKAKPYPKQSALEFYNAVKEHIAYIHIKDGVWNTEKQECEYCYPGLGDGNVIEIVGDLIANGYEGGISIEPHIENVFHDDDNNSKTDYAKQHAMYVEYGKRMAKIIEDAGGVIR